MSESAVESGAVTYLNIQIAELQTQIQKHQEASEACMSRCEEHQRTIAAMQTALTQLQDAAERLQAV